MTTKSEKFNYLVLIISMALIFSVFAKFTNAPGIQIALFLFLGVFFCSQFNTYKADYKNFLLPAIIFTIFVLISYYFSGYRYGARNGVFLISYSVSAYMLSGFMSEYDKRSIMIIPVFISLWLTIYLLHQTLLSANFLNRKYFQAIFLQQPVFF